MGFRLKMFRCICNQFKCIYISVFMCSQWQWQWLNFQFQYLANVMGIGMSEEKPRPENGNGNDAKKNVIKWAITVICLGTSFFQLLWNNNNSIWLTVKDMVGLFFFILRSVGYLVIALSLPIVPLSVVNASCVKMLIACLWL